MKTSWVVVCAAVVLALGAGVVYANQNSLVPIVAMGINYVRYLSAPAGTLTTELAGSNEPQATASSPNSSALALAADKTPTDFRYSALALLAIGKTIQVVTPTETSPRKA